MVAPPPTGWPDPYVIHPFQDSSLTGANEGGSGGNVSSGVVTANLAFFHPFCLGQRRTYQTVWWVNGAAVSGNVDIGVYDTTGTKKFSLGSTAQAGISSFQQVTLGAAQTLEAGRYFLAWVIDNNTGQIVNGAPTLLHTRGMGGRERAASFPLPSDASSWTGSTVGRIICCGLSELSTL